MKFINEVGRDVQGCCSGHANHGANPLEWAGWYCELLLVSTDKLGGKELPIYIEGDGANVIAALETALHMAKGQEQLFREEFEQRRLEEQN